MSSGKDILKTLQKEMMEENKSSMSESLHPKRQMQKDKNGKDRKEMGDEEEEEDMASQSVDFLSENKKSSRSKPEKNVRSNTSRKEEEKPHRMSHTNDKTSSSSSSSSSRTAKDSKTTATTPTNSSSAKPKSTTTNTQKKANEGKSVTVTIDQEKERMSKESTKEQGKMNDKDQKITKIAPTSNEKIDEKQKPEEQNSKETAKSVVQPKKSQSVKVEELPKDPRKKKEIDNTGGPKAVTIVKNKDEKGGEGEKSIITTPKSPKTATNTKKSSSENSTGMVKTNSRKRKEISEEEEEDDEERENDESNTDKSKRITRAKRVQKVAPEKKVREVRKRVVNGKPKKPLSKGKKMDEQEQEEENDDNNEDSTSEENRVDVASLDQNDSSEVGEMEDGMEENDDALMCDEAIINYKVGKFMDNVQEKKSNEKLIIDNCEDRRVFPKKLRDKVKTHFRTSSAFQKRDTLTCLTQMSIGFLQLVDKFLSKCEKENRKECSKMTPKEKLEFNGRNVDLFVANRDLWRKRRIVRNNLAKKSPHKGTKTSCKGTPKKNKN